MSKWLKFFALGILIASILPLALADSSEKKPKIRHISEDFPVDANGTESQIVPSKLHQEDRVSGVQYQTTCTDIDPQVGTVIQHDQIGDTWYDFQKNGSMGRMISVTSDGYRHFSWMYTDGPYPGRARYVNANCKQPDNSYTGVDTVEGSEISTPGYCNQTHLHTGHSVLIYHKSGYSGGYRWGVTMSKETGSVSSGFYSENWWDLPDSIAGSTVASTWPKAVALYNAEVDTDYIHIVFTEGNTAPSPLVMLGYERAHWISGDTVLCEYCQGATRQAFKVPKNTAINFLSPPPITRFDSSCSITPVVAVSPVSRRVAIAWLKPADPAGTADYLTDACWIESMDNGEDWLSNCANWPPPENNITNFGTTGSQRCYNDISACYDYNDSLHILYTTVGFDSSQPGVFFPRQSRLYHWSKKDGTTMITTAIWEGTEPGTHNANITKASIAALDSIYHSGSDSVYLYCIWTQFDTADNSANGYTNGDIYGAGSPDGGATWGLPFNLTNTKTPDCLPGTCLSEHWSSLATNMYDGNLHIQYICDRDAGTALAGQDETSWQDNPVMYLELQVWNPLDTPLIANFSAEPRSGVAPLNVNFTDFSLGDPVSWLWDFGDGYTDTVHNPAHTYSYNDTGYFNIKLVIQDETETDSIIKDNYIRVLRSDSIPFAPAVNYDAGDGPYSVFCADLEGDTDLDLAVANVNSEYVSILKNNGDGTFQNKVDYVAGNNPASVFCADLDGDGDLDLAVANNISANVSILKNNGDGTFQSAVNYGAGDNPYSIFCADLDGDYDLDLAVANEGGNNVSILKNNGDGTFQSAVNYGAGDAPLSVFCADLDNDHDLDLAVASQGSDNVSILKNNGDGTFQSAVNYEVGGHPLSVFCADLDGDEDIDLAVTVNIGIGVSILKNNGNGTFQSAVHYDAGFSPMSIFCADLDGDGDLDLAMVGFPYIHILKNNGDGTFQSAVHYDAGF
jgi:PKD repeat protein